MQYYMLRMMNHENGFGRKLFENGFAAIGYRDFDKANNFDFISIYKEAQAEKQEEKILKENIKKCWNGEKIGSHWKIDKFFNFKIGDFLLIPDYKCFHFVEITSNIIPFESIKEKFCTNNKIPDIGFVYEIKKIHLNISRNDFLEAKLTARLKNISGLLNITDLKEEIENSIKAFEEKKPINLNENLKNILYKSTLKELMKSLNANKFEILLTKIMEKLGATTVDIPAKNNKDNTTEGIGDVDVVAVFEKLKHIIYIQAKFHNGESNSWALEQLNDYNKEEEGYTQAFWAITTADNFNEEAKNLVHSDNCKNIRLINGPELAKLILDIGIEGIN